MTLNFLKPIDSIVLAIMGLVVTACAAHGPGDNSSDNPIEQKFSWFSYLEGGDIRAACRLGSDDRYRMVYNAVYTEQVRTYDLYTHEGAGGRLDVRVMGTVNLSEVHISSLSDLLNPWRGQTASLDLSADDLAKIETALVDDGMFGPPAVGTELSSKGFFWTVAACREGRYHFSALAWPSAAWDAMRFDDALFALDPVMSAVNPPRKTALGRQLSTNRRTLNKVEFHTKVGENGLYGFAPLGE